MCSVFDTLHLEKLCVHTYLVIKTDSDSLGFLHFVVLSQIQDLKLHLILQPSATKQDVHSAHE